MVYRKAKQEHNNCLESVLETIRAAGITLNPTKCEFAKPSLAFLSHLIDKEGISQDPTK